MGNSLIKLPQRKRSNESGPTENQRRRNQENAKNSHGIPVASHSNENQHSIPPSIFKLNGDCFDELFEYLSLKDLHSLGQTCKSMHQMAGAFFSRNYSAAKFNCLRDSIYMFEIRKVYYGTYTKVDIDQCIPIPGFIPLITWIAIENNILDRVDIRITGWKNRHSNYVYHLDMGKFKYFKLHSDQFKSVKKLTLTNVSINRQTVGYILKILPNIEVLELQTCSVTQDFYAVFLKYCKNVRRIQLSQVKFKNNYKWLRQQYEKLEHLELNVNTNHRIDELRTFFDRNPNMRSFSCNSSTFLSNQDALMNSKSKLDVFELNNTDELDTGTPPWDLLSKLYDHGVYERLHLRSEWIWDWSGLPETPFLKQLVLDGAVSPLNHISDHLIEYCETAERDTYSWGIPVDDSEASKNERFVESLINVERLYANRKHFDILLFIQRLRKLEKLKLFKFESAEILQLDELNNEREKLAGARKVTIYVPDPVFLATKWATRNGITNFSLIEMKRIDSYEWNRSCRHKFLGLQLPPGIL